jgi:hypothetical protein
MSRSEFWNSSISIALHALVSLLILGIGAPAQGAGPRSASMDLSATCEFVANAQAVDPQGFSGSALLVAGVVTGGSGTSAVADHLCGGVTIALEEQGKGPWTALVQVSADPAADGSFSQLVPLCDLVTQNPDARVARAVVSVLVSGSSCADGTTQTLVTRCTDASMRGNRPAVNLPSPSTLDAMCADANI